DRPGTAGYPNEPAQRTHAAGDEQIPRCTERHDRLRKTGWRAGGGSRRGTGQGGTLLDLRRAGCEPAHVCLWRLVDDRRPRETNSGYERGDATAFAARDEHRDQRPWPWR